MLSPSKRKRRTNIVVAIIVRAVTIDKGRSNEKIMNQSSKLIQKNVAKRLRTSTFANAKLEERQPSGNH